jgi:hypothetical protein
MLPRNIAEVISFNKRFGTRRRENFIPFIVSLRSLLQVVKVREHLTRLYHLTVFFHIRPIGFAVIGCGEHYFTPA